VLPLWSPVVVWLICAVTDAVCVSPVAFTAFSATIAMLSAVALDCVIEHSCVTPVVLMHLATFGVLAAATWTTAQLALVQWK
jgi:hypothetical protein